MPTKSYDNARWIYISMKNAVNILQKSIKDTRVAIVGGRIPMDPDKIRILRSRIRMDLLPYCESGSMIPVDLRQTMSVGSMIRMDPGSRSLGSDPGIRFRDPRTCLVRCFTASPRSSPLSGVSPVQSSVLCLPRPVPSLRLPSPARVSRQPTVI